MKGGSYRAVELDGPDVSPGDGEASVLGVDEEQPPREERQPACSSNRPNRQLVNTTEEERRRFWVRDEDGEGLTFLVRGQVTAAGQVGGVRSGQDVPQARAVFPLSKTHRQRGPAQAWGGAGGGLPDSPGPGGGPAPTASPPVPSEKDSMGVRGGRG